MSDEDTVNEVPPQLKETRTLEALDPCNACGADTNEVCGFVRSGDEDADSPKDNGPLFRIIERRLWQEEGGDEKNGRCSVCEEGIDPESDTWRAVRQCRNCNAYVCEKCIAGYLERFSVEVGDSFSENMTKRRVSLTRWGVFLFTTVLIGVIICLFASYLVDQSIFTKSVVWYGSCDVPGYGSCNSDINSYTQVRTAAQINTPSKAVPPNPLNQRTDITPFYSWMDYVGLTEFITTTAVQRTVGPIVTGLFGAPATTVMMPYVSDVYTDETIFTGTANTGFFKQYNLTVTAIVATPLLNFSHYVIAALNRTSASALGFAFNSTLTNNTAKQTAIPTSMLAYFSGYPFAAYGISGPNSTANSTLRLFTGNTSSTSFVVLNGARATLITQVTAALPLGVCLDKDPSHADLPNGQKIGFARTTSCYMYGQESDVSPPWIFLLFAAVKNVIMIFVVQAVLSWFMGRVKNALKGSGFIAWLGPKAVAWTRTPPLPRIVQRTEMFHPSDAYQKANALLDARLAKLREDYHSEATERQDASALSASDFANEDVAMIDMLGNLVSLAGAVPTNFFAESKYYELRLPDAVWIRRWFCEQNVPYSEYGSMQSFVLASSPYRDSFPLNEDERNLIIAAFWSANARLDPVQEYSADPDLKQYAKLHGQMTRTIRTLLQYPLEKHPFPAIAMILRDAGLPAEWLPQFHEVIAKDLWAMTHESYDYGQPLNVVYSKQTVLLYALVYVCSDDDNALRIAGMREFADQVQLATTYRIKMMGVEVEDDVEVIGSVSEEAHRRILTVRKSLMHALNHCEGSRRMGKVIWDARPIDESKKDTDGFGGPDGTWRFEDLIEYYRQVFVGMPQARGALSEKIQLAHHIVNTAYPKIFFVWIGFVVSFGILVNAAVQAHELALRETRTVMLPFFNRWVNSGILVSNLTYLTQLMNIPSLYRIDRANYQRPLGHTLYLGVTAIAIITALPLSLAGWLVGAPVLILVGAAIFSASAMLTKALTSIARAMDKTGSGTLPTFINIAYTTLMMSIYFGLFIQTSNNVGYNLVLNFFETNTLPTDPMYFLTNAVGAEYLGRRLSCTLEQMSLTTTNLVGTLSYLALP